MNTIGIILAMPLNLLSHLKSRGRGAIGGSIRERITQIT